MIVDDDRRDAVPWTLSSYDLVSTGRIIVLCRTLNAPAAVLFGGQVSDHRAGVRRSPLLEHIALSLSQASDAALHRTELVISALLDR